MADEITITITNNVGNDKYNQSAREFLSAPIEVDMMKVILGSEAQINNTIKIRNQTSYGTSSNRDINLRNYIRATDQTNLIIDVPLVPPVLLDGKTYFEVEIEPQNTIDLLFTFEQYDISSLL